jgi:hypothetical protein
VQDVAGAGGDVLLALASWRSYKPVSGPSPPTSAAATRPSTPQQCGSVDDFSDYIHDSQVDPRIHYLEMNQSCQAQYGTINALLLGP